MYVTTIYKKLTLPCLLFLCSCAGTKKITQPASSISAIKLIGQYEIPYNMAYNKTTVGGLSGIDYDRSGDQYYFICDDRSDKNPARFYTAKIYLKPGGIHSIAFTGVHFMLQPDGTVYPNNKQDRFHTPDPEAMRYNPVNKTLVWTSEGERIVSEKDSILVNPAILIVQPGGTYIDSFPLPANLWMHADPRGPRKNSTLEGISFANNYQTLYVSVEEPLYDDGPAADIKENDAFCRIYKFDLKTKACMAQYAYKLAPVAYPSVPESAFKINGIPDILSVGNDKLLVIERSFSTGRLSCSIRLFIADLNGATDISRTTLKNNKDFTPASKKLLLNMDDLGIYTDNVEGVTFGPTLPNGHKTLLFVADNNFNALEKAQVFLFEIVEE